MIRQKIGLCRTIVLVVAYSIVCIYLLDTVRPYLEPMCTLAGLSIECMRWP
jgi:hypothetical protein